MRVPNDIADVFGAHHNIAAVEEDAQPHNLQSHRFHGAEPSRAIGRRSVRPAS